MTVSDELESWASLAGFSLTRNAECIGTDLFWNRGGELRYFVRDRADGGTEVTYSDRLGPEGFEFSGASPVVVERFLFGFFGDSYRSIKDLPFVMATRAVDDLDHGYRVALQEVTGVNRYTLIDASDAIIAVCSGGRLLAPDRLARLSTILHATVDEIKESFRREDGSPLLKIRV
ncbi:Imm61 family immunity protein [Mycobacterium sp. SMC-18]|uniref:Imm61 family immunity protein n=1 Tax=Mycobacterium sp. SMC-18 TaxID=3381629 RepID=UPI0038760461